MALYEHVFLVRQDATPQQVDALAEQMKSVVESGGGKVTKTENWGLRTMAFRIKKNRKAYYALFNIDGPWAAIAEMERQEKINEDILRFMTVRVDELEEGPSAMMIRKDKEERFEREGREGGERRPRRRDGEESETVETEEEVAL